MYLRALQNTQIPLDSVKATEAASNSVFVYGPRTTNKGPEDGQIVTVADDFPVHRDVWEVVKITKAGLDMLARGEKQLRDEVVVLPYPVAGVTYVKLPHEQGAPAAAAAPMDPTVAAQLAELRAELRAERLQNEANQRKFDELTRQQVAAAVAGAGDGKRR